MVLVTGGTGLIGSYIIRCLINKNYSVRALKRPDSNFELLQDIRDKVEWVEGDINDVTFLDSIFNDIEYVVHAAAIFSFERNEKKILKVNFEGTSNIVNAALKHNIKKMLHISSIAALGTTKGSLITNEEAVFDPNVNSSSYSKSKYLAELEVWRGASEGLNVVIVNPSIVLGPGNWERGSSSLFRLAWKNQSFYTFGNLNFIDVRDVAEISIMLMESDISSERFILNAGTSNLKTFFDLVAESFNKKKPSLMVTPLMLRFFLPLKQLFSPFLKGLTQINRETVQILFNKSTFDNNKVRTALNYDFRPLEETIQWTCKQLILKYKLKK